MRFKFNNKSIYFIALFMYILSYFAINVPIISEIVNIIKVSSYLLFSLVIGLNFKLKFDKENIKELILLVMLICINLFFVNSIFMLEFLLIIMASKEMEFDDIVKYSLYSKLLVFFIVVSTNLIGITNSKFIILRNDVIRESFGFYHPNTFGLFTIITYIEFLYCNRKKFGYKSIIFGLLLVLFISIKSNARTSVLGGILIIGLLLFKNLIEKFIYKKSVKEVLKYLFVLLLILSIYLTIMYLKQDKLALDLNTKLTGRIHLQALYLNNYNIKLVPQKLDLIKTLDNGYINLLLSYGVLTIAFYSYIYLKLMNKAVKEKNTILIMIIVVQLLLSTFETFLHYMYFNIFILYIFTKTKKENIQQEVSNQDKEKVNGK